MSLYNMLHGNHPLAGHFLAVLGFAKVIEIPRFRDIFLFDGEIRILTRTGGGNRSAYETQNDSLKVHEGYLRNWDDDFDNTFAWWAYKWPEDPTVRKLLTVMLEQIKEKRPELLPESLEEPTNRAIEKMKAAP